MLEGDSKKAAKSNIPAEAAIQWWLCRVHTAGRPGRKPSLKIEGVGGVDAFKVAITDCLLYKQAQPVEPQRVAGQLQRYYSMQQARAIKQACLPGWLGAIRQVRPGGGGGVALAGFEVYPPYPYLPTRGCGGKVGAGFQPGVYKITHTLQTSSSNTAIYDNYTGVPENQGVPRRNGSPG